MKTDRFSPAATRAAAVLLAGLFVAAGAAGQVSIRFKLPVGKKASPVAAALAGQVKEVQKRFDRSRHALRTVPGPGGEPALPRQEVAGLITRTEEDLDQAIQQVQEPGLNGLRAWAAEELRSIQDELAASGRTAALSPGLSAPQAVARIARLGGLPEPQSVIAAASPAETVSAGTSSRLLDQVGEVIGRIFLLADKDDLEVDLWVGSMPAPATFRFWSQGRIQGAAPAPLVIRTNGRRERVLRGLYVYRAALSNGAVTEVVEYPSPAGDRADRSERLDLVKGSSFFCCRFGEQSCHHVTGEKECRP